MKRLDFTGHPFIDVGLAAITAYVDKRSIADLTESNLDSAASYIEKNYVRPPLRGYLTMAFTSNAWFVQDAFNPNKPGLSTEKRAEIQATRDRWARNHLRQWESPEESSGELCIFTGLPAASQALSGKLPAGRIGRNQMPLLQGDDTINFFTNGTPGLPIASEALLALQFMPMGCAKVGVGLLAVHSDSERITIEFARAFWKQTSRQVVLAQTAGEEKLPGANRALKTLMVELLLQIEESRLREARILDRAASVTAYNFNNGKTPQLVIYHLPLQITTFLRTVQTPTYIEAWQKLSDRGWQQVSAKSVKSVKKGEAVKGDEPRSNYLYEDLFTLPQQARSFVRRYFLRIPRKSFPEDPRGSYSPTRERDLVSWPLVELFLKEVMTMDDERIVRIKALGDKLANYARKQGGKRFFRQFFIEQKQSHFMNLLMKTNIDYTKFMRGEETLFDLDSFVMVFMDGDEVLRPDWRMARDLVLIRMIEQLRDWIADNPDAITDDDIPSESE